MSLSSIDFLASVVTARPPFSVVFTDWVSMMDAVGVGLRWLMPQFNHRLMRLDLAAPADALERARLVFSFDQAF